MAGGNDKRLLLTTCIPKTFSISKLLCSSTELKSLVNELMSMVSAKIRTSLITPYLILSLTFFDSSCVCSINSVSIVIPNTSDIFTTLRLFGYPSLSSHFEIDLSLTSNNSASCCCVSPLSARYSFN